MKLFAPSILAISLALGSTNAVQAQDQTPPAASADAGQNAAVKAPHDMGSGLLVEGRNSFTRGEARAHIRRAGYTHVAGLTKTRDGLWQARALRRGRRVGVSLDFRGRVAAR